MQKGWLLLFCVLLVGCHSNTDLVTVSLRVASLEELGSPPFPGFRRAVPNTALEHPCFFLTVSGGGISNGPNLPPAYNGTCWNAGRISQVGAVTGGSVAPLSVQVPSGSGRLVRLIGVDTTGQACQNTALENLLVSDFAGLHTLGERVVNLDGDAVVTLPNIYSSESAVDQLADCAIPTPTEASPSSISLGGGQEIVVTGSGFLPGVDVRIGAKSCLNPRADSPTKIRCASAPNIASTLPLLVINANGRNGDTPITYVDDEVSETNFAGAAEVFTGAGGIDAISVAQSNGQSLFFVDSGLSPNIQGGFIDPDGNIVEFDSPLRPEVNQELDATSHGDYVYFSFMDSSDELRAYRINTTSLTASSPVLAADMGTAIAPSTFGQSMASFGNKLWIAYAKGSASRLLRVVVSDGEGTWADGDGGADINHNPAENAEYPHLAIHNDSLFVAWEETVSSVGQIHVSQLVDPDTFQWNSVDGDDDAGVRLTTTDATTRPQLISHNNKLYVFWMELFSTHYVLRAAVWDGVETWTALTDSVTDITVNPAFDSKQFQVSTHNGKLYVIWAEGSLGGPTPIHLAVYDGQDGLDGFTVLDSMPLNQDTVGGSGDTDTNAEGSYPRLLEHQTGWFLFYAEEFLGEVPQVLGVKASP